MCRNRCRRFRHSRNRLCIPSRGKGREHLLPRLLHPRSPSPLRPVPWPWGWLPSKAGVGRSLFLQPSPDPSLGQRPSRSRAPNRSPTPSRRPQPMPDGPSPRPLLLQRYLGPQVNLNPLRPVRRSELLSRAPPSRPDRRLRGSDSPLVLSPRRDRDEWSSPSLPASLNPRRTLSRPGRLPVA